MLPQGALNVHRKIKPQKMLMIKIGINQFLLLSLSETSPLKTPTFTELPWHLL